MRKQSLREELEQDRREEAEEDADGAEWDRWMALSEEEQDAELETAMRQLQESRAHWTVEQHYRAHRRSYLKSCLRRRDLAKRMRGADFMVKFLKEVQLQLVKLRVYRRTGVYPSAQ